MEDRFVTRMRPMRPQLEGDMRKRKGKRSFPVIRQIMPATGWRAAYFEEPEGPDGSALKCKPLMCFALVEFPDGWTGIDGMINEDDGCIVPCGTTENHFGYIAPGQDTEVWEDRAGEALERSRKRGHR